MSTQAQWHERKAEVQAALQLDSEPTDEFMALLAELVDGDVGTAPTAPLSTRSYTPGEIVEIVINGTTGDLLCRARGDRTLASVGEEAGVTRARIQQLEHSTNDRDRHVRARGRSVRLRGERAPAARFVPAYPPFPRYSAQMPPREDCVRAKSERRVPSES